MKKVIKKNQIIITALALMIAVAGYINYKDNFSDKKQKEESAKVVSQMNADQALNLGEVDSVSGDILSNDAEPDENSLTEPGQAVLTGGTSTSQSEFIINARLDREQVRASNKETLLEIVNNANIDDASKQSAIEEMIRMTDIAERETAAELLLEAKGFTDVIVSITQEQADVVVNKEELSDTDRAKIEDVIIRKAGVPIENIVIMGVCETDVAQMTENDETIAGEETK